MEDYRHEPFGLLRSVMSYTPVPPNTLSRRSPFIEPYLHDISDALGITLESVMILRGEYINATSLIEQEREFTDIIKSFKSLEVAKDDCVICLSKPDKLVVLPCCKKEFCSDCITRWARTNRSCPHCRKQLNSIT